MGTRSSVLAGAALAAAVAAGCSGPDSDEEPAWASFHEPGDESPTAAVAAGAERERLPLSAKRALGTNLGKVVDWSPEWAFANAFRASRPWISGAAGGAWDDERPLDLDAHGWVRSLQPGQVARTLLFWKQEDGYPSGDYTVLYEGKGRLDYWHGVDDVDRGEGRDVLEVDASEGGIGINLVEVDPSDPIRNIRVLMPGIDPQQADGFHPLFLQRLAPYGVIRFMDWMKTNDEPPGRWSERPTVEDARWSEEGVPVEVMVALANRLQADPWFTLPHTADDEYVRRFAEVVRDRLAPGLKAYVEYSNEVWNGQFPQAKWVQRQGQALGLGKNAKEAGRLFYGNRAVEIFRIFAQVFGDTDRLVRVLGAQAAGPRGTETILSCDGATQHADALAIAPYFGGRFGGRKERARVKGMSVEDLLAVLEREALPRAEGYMREHAALAKECGMRLITYEGGQHLVVHGGKDPALDALFDAANRHPRMGALYARYLDAWSRHGELFVHYSSCTNYTRSGRWGALESLLQPRKAAPKYDALCDYVEGEAK